MSLKIILLQLIVFMDLFAIGLIVPIMTIQMRQRGASHIQIGLLGSIYAAFQLISGPLMGSLSDLKGRRKVLLMTLIVCGIAYTLIGVSESVVIILCLRAVLGIFKQTQMLSRAMVPDYEKSETRQSAIYGRMAAFSGVGFTLGPMIGGHIQEDFPDCGFMYIALAAGVCFLINTGIVYNLPEPRQPARGKSRQSDKTTKSLVENVIFSLKQSVIRLTQVNWAQYWDIFLMKGLIGFAMSVYFSNYSLYLKTVYQLSPKYIGYIISFQGIIGAITSFNMGTINNLYVHDTDYSLRNVHVFSMISVSFLGLLLSANEYIYVLWLVPLAIANAVGRLTTLELILKRSHGNHRGTLIGASNSVRSLSGVAAPMAAGLINQYLGMPYVTCASLLASLLGLGMSYSYKYKKIKVD